MENGRSLWWMKPYSPVGERNTPWTRDRNETVITICEFIPTKLCSLVDFNSNEPHRLLCNVWTLNECHTSVRIVGTWSNYPNSRTTFQDSNIPTTANMYQYPRLFSPGTPHCAQLLKGKWKNYTAPEFEIKWSNSTHCHKRGLDVRVWWSAPIIVWKSTSYSMRFKWRECDAELIW